MEITNTIISYGNKDLLIILAFLIFFFISFIVSLYKANSALTPFMMFMFTFLFLIMFIGTAFIPEQTTFKAKITDYEVAQEKGYIILEHLDDDNYYIEKVKK